MHETKMRVPMVHLGEEGGGDNDGFPKRCDRRKTYENKVFCLLGDHNGQKTI